QRWRARATSARSCSAACRLFFESDVVMLEEAPHRAAAARNLVPVHRQNRLVQGQVWPSRNQTQQKICMLLQRRDAPAPPLTRTAARLPKALDPDNRRAGTDIKLLGRRAPRRPAFNFRNHSRPHVFRIGLRHRPASQNRINADRLSHPSPSENLLDSIGTEHALVVDCARFAEGLLSEKDVRKKWRFDESTWESLGKDDALIERIEAEKLRRIRDGSLKRERAQNHIVAAPDILNTIMSDPKANAKHRIDSAKVLDTLAANGSTASEAGDRVIVTINLGADTKLRFDKPIRPSPNDGEIIDAVPGFVIKGRQRWRTTSLNAYPGDDRSRPRKRRSLTRHSCFWTGYCDGLSRSSAQKTSINSARTPSASIERMQSDPPRSSPNMAG